jgi:hypothetical protein
VFLRREKWISSKASGSSKEEIVLQLLIIGGAKDKAFTEM